MFFLGKPLLSPSLLLLLAVGVPHVEVPTTFVHDSFRNQDDQPGGRFTFEVISIRPHNPSAPMENTQYLPDGYKASFNLAAAIKQAFLPQWSIRTTAELKNAPDWVEDDWYDINARVAPEDVQRWQNSKSGVDSDLLDNGLQAMLIDRFRLALHLVPTEVPCLELVVTKPSSGLRESVPGSITAVAGKTYRLGSGFFVQEGDQRRFAGVSMDELVRYLTIVDKSQVFQNKTNLTGRYDFSLQWLSDSHMAEGNSHSSTLTSLAKLGLSLKPGKTKSVNIVIDHVERPSPN